MKKRCIMIFQSFKNIEVIDEIRDKYDPLAKHVRPHITLAFPFNSEIETDDLKKHISSVLEDLCSFEISLSKVTPVDSHGKYLFLNVEEGKDKVIKLHNRLYTGILESYYPKWLKEGEYLPHMTVGSFGDDNEFKVAIDDTKDIDCEFRTMVGEVSVEIIDENDNSIIELNISLNELVYK